MASPAPAPAPADIDGGGPVSARPAGLTIAAGAASVVVGAVVLIWPDASIVVLAWLFGLQLIIAGILQLVAACWRDAGVAARVLLGLAGAFSILVGLLCLRAPLQTAVLLGLMVGAAWVVTGLLGIVLAFGGGHDRSRGWSIVSGILSTIGGAVVLLNPGVSIVVLTWILGLVLVASGLFVLLQGLASRHSGDRTVVAVDAPQPGPAAPSPY
jgi:uncharacterized membrane protein HdeD (DUF308 family)